MEQVSWEGIRFQQKFSGPAPWRQLRGSLVIGWDRNDASSAALRYAVQLADLLALHIHVVHAVDSDDMAINPETPDWEESMAVNLDLEAAGAEQFLADVDTSWTYYAAYGNPADLLIEFADRCRAMMVVIGSPRKGIVSFVESIAGQSVARRVIGRRSLPVLVVPADCTPGDIEGW